MEAKRTKAKRLETVVIDTRSLNRIVLPDAYPIPFQQDILSALEGANFITIASPERWRIRRPSRPWE